MYTQQGSYFNFFVPNILLAQAAAEVLVAVDIGAASADHGEILCVKPCQVERLMFTMTEEAASGTVVAPHVIFTKRPTPLSATGEVVIGTVIVPSGTAIGKTVYLDIDPVSFVEGDSIEISHVIGTGTPTGIGLWSLVANENPNTPANNADMIASA